jgi:hypothetical protein
VTGEISLSGRIRKVAAVLAKATNLNAGFVRFLYPTANTPEAAAYVGPLWMLAVPDMQNLAGHIVKGAMHARMLLWLAKGLGLTTRRGSFLSADGPRHLPRAPHDLAEATIVLAPDSDRERSAANIGDLPIEACVVPGTGQASLCVPLIADIYTHITLLHATRQVVLTGFVETLSRTAIEDAWEWVRIATPTILQHLQVGEKSAATSSYVALTRGLPLSRRCCWGRRSRSALTSAR